MRAPRSLALLALLLACGLLHAQEDPPDFLRVYQYDQPMAGWGELNAWTGYVGSSNQAYEHFGEDLGREGLWAHSLEGEYGLTDRVAVGGYLDFEHARGGGTHFTQGRILARYRFANRQDLFFNTGLYLEYYMPRAGYGDHELEARLILDKDLNDFRLAINPRLSRLTSGPDSGEVDAALDAGLYYRRFDKVQPGLEYHGEYGKWGQWQDKKQYIEPTLDVGLARQLTWHVGVAFGLDHAADHVLFQSILTWEFNAVRPSVLFGRVEPGQTR